MERSVRRLLSYQHDSDADVAHAERSWRRLSVKRDACGDLASGIRLVIILAAYKHGWAPPTMGRAGIFDCSPVASRQIRVAKKKFNIYMPEFVWNQEQLKGDFAVQPYVPLVSEDLWRLPSITPEKA